MPPQTRSRDRVQTPASAPASRVYRSNRPPQQTRFRSRSTSIKTYGRRRQSKRSSLKQQTLTQIDYLVPPDGEDGMDLLEDGEEEREREREQEREQEREPGRERPQKRRKTMGDTPTSSFHTQTLTQFLSTKGDGDENEADDDLLSLAPPVSEAGKVQNRTDEAPGGNDRRLASIIPQTPAGKRVVVEIPSSQQSDVLTPMLGRYSMTHRSPLGQRSTNIAAPPPTEAAMSTVSKRPRNLVIQDTFSSSHSSLKSQSQRNQASIHRTPLKPILLSSQKAELDFDEEGIVGDESPSPSTRRLAKSTRQPLIEIPDSDDELGNLGPTPQKPGAGPLESIEETPQKNDEDEETASEESDAGPGTPTPLPKRAVTSAHRGSPEQTVATPVPSRRATSTRALARTPAIEVTPKTPIPSSQSARATRGSARAIEISSDIPSSARRIATPEAVPSSNPQIEDTPLSSPPPAVASGKKSAAQQPSAKSQFHSQGLESQRVPLDTIRAMGPQSDRSDIIISIHPEHVERIVDGTKDHEFRGYKIPHTVTRMWIYMTRPVCELRYMAVISQFKQPGEINSASGVGNAEFNAGRMAKFAYELRQVYQLNNPVSLEMMKRNGWIEGPPQKYTYVPPTVVGALLGNLRCALFQEREGCPADEDEVEPDLSISQEVEAQLQSDIAHTQKQQQQEKLPMSEASEEVIPASQGPITRARAGVLSRARTARTRTGAAPRTVAATPPRAGRKSTTAAAVADEVEEENTVRPSQATTASLPSSQVPSPEKSSAALQSSVARPAMCSSVPSLSQLPLLEDDSPVLLRSGSGSAVRAQEESEGRLEQSERPFSVSSSQAIALPESLYDDVRRAPVVMDSEDEGDDL